MSPQWSAERLREFEASWRDLEEHCRDHERAEDRYRETLERIERLSRDPGNIKAIRQIVWRALHPEGW